ncbi:MAG: metal ABC transporter permease [Planctomycetota bacterium]
MNALQALLDPQLFLPSLVASILAALTCGISGPLVVSRRLVFLAGAIAHVAVGGIGAAVYGGFDPVFGALSAAILGALLLSVVRHLAHDHLDTLIGALWAVGMAIGLILAKLSPGYQVELMSYLFGYLAAASWADVQLLLILDCALIGAVLLTYKRLVAVALDPEQVRLQGLSVWAMDALLLVLVAISVVALMRVVGLILVISLICLPAATAGRFAIRLPNQMALASALAIVLVIAPRILVFGTPVAPEPAIVIAAALVYLSALTWRRRQR